MPTPQVQVTDNDPLIRNISDTALWAAVFRGLENERPDALFRDPFAKRLAGDRGAKIATEMKFGFRHAWSWMARTYVVDQMIGEQIALGTDMVINLAAGLDARPFRMALPASLAWVEIDLPGILEFKEQALAGERAVCGLERIKLDLTEVSARREVFGELGRRAKKAIIISEGLVVYLSTDEVAALSVGLARQATFCNWVLDICSPALLRRMQKTMGSQLKLAGAPMKFGPEEGPDYFLPFGWKPLRAQSMLHAAARVKRLPLWMRPFALFPDRFPPRGKRPWGGVCLLGRV